jgi:hypothetical protein
METTWMVAFGVLMVLPQVVGFAASRISRRRSAVIWALAAPATLGLVWAISTLVEYFGPGRARTQHYAEVPFLLISISLLVFHFAVGAILGVLDQRARTRRATPPSP